MKKQDSFEGQQMVVLPFAIRDMMLKNDLTKHLYVADIGYFPRAKFHTRERKVGSLDNILILCAEGKGWVNCHGKRFALAKDQYFIIPKGVEHSYGADFNDPWSIQWVHFNGALSDHFIGLAEYPKTLSSSNHDLLNDRARVHLEMIRVLQRSFSIESLEYCSLLLTQYLANFKYESVKQNLKHDELKNAATSAIAFMKQHLSQKVELREIAEHCQLSVSHFCLYFKKQTSHTPIEYLTMLRVQKACEYLSLTNLKVTEIAHQLGFRDAYYFTRVFTKSIGYSPINYRKRNGQKLV